MREKRNSPFEEFMKQPILKLKEILASGMYDEKKPYDRPVLAALKLAIEHKERESTTGVQKDANKIARSAKNAAWGAVVVAVFSIIAGATMSILLNKRVDTAMTLKQDVVQTVNIVTEVKKEIANLHDAIEQLYKDISWEYFTSNDLGSRLKPFKNPEGNKNYSVIYFQLKEIPIKESVLVSHESGMVSPNTYVIYKNIVAFKSAQPVEQVLKGEIAYFYIRYTKEFEPKDKPITIDDMINQGQPEYMFPPGFKDYNKQ